MSRFGTAAVLCCVLQATACFADEFADFRIPSHHVRSLTLTSSLSGTRSRASTQSSLSGQTLRSDQLGGGFNASGWWLFDSDPTLASLTVQGAVSGNRRTSSSNDVSGTLPVQSTQSASAADRFVYETVVLTAGYRHYPWRVPIGLDAEVIASASPGQSWSRSASNDLFVSPSMFTSTVRQANSTTWTYNYAASATAAVGYGRVRDATGVFEARVLEDRLRETGALRQALSPAARARLAALYYVAYGYRVHDRPDKYFWRNVESILRDDGALAGPSLDAFSVFKGNEPYGPIRVSFLRQAGYFVGLGATVRHIHYLRRFDGQTSDTFENAPNPPVTYGSAQSTRDRVADDLVLLGPQAEAHLPLGLRWQADATGTVKYPLEHVRHGVYMASSASLGYLVTDRWNVRAGVSHSRSFLDDKSSGVLPDRDYAWSVDYSLLLGFFVEDHVLLNLQASENQHRVNLLGQYVRSGQFNLRLTYRFLGLLSAPGIIDADPRAP
jgi:hypothetical protein